MTPESLKIRLTERLQKPIESLQKMESGCRFPSFVCRAGQSKFFVKASATPTNEFSFETTGLKQLQKHGASVPEVHTFDEHFLVLEYIQPETPKVEFWQNLAQQLAAIHQKSAPSFGFFENNSIGAAPQQNVASDRERQDWAAFFWNHRLHNKILQLEAQAETPLSGNELKHLQEACFALLGERQPTASALHGDLWNGNIICGPGQRPYLIDPAFYFGDRETDLAMTECFGGFPEDFYKSYHQALPPDPGYDQRKHLYNLYHMLNHQVIFGQQYESAVRNIVKLLIE